MSQTTNLMLPYLAPGQAQKHVTVNESLRKLDAIVQLAVVSASTTAEPGSPADGAVYIVPAGKTGTHWAAYADGALGYYRDGAWVEIAPREGWLAWVRDDDEFLCFDGTGWEPLAGGGASDAGDVTFDAAGLAVLTGTDVQAALEEADAALDALSSGTVPDGDKGDITVSSGVWTIDNDTVTYAKLQNVSATDRLLGRDSSGAGDAEELTVGGGVEFTGSGGIQRSALTGDVTASAGSGATTIANDAVTYAKMQNVSAQNRLLGRKSSGAGDPEELTPAEGRALLAIPEVLIIAVGDETTTITSGAGKVAFRMPFAMTLSAVRASLVTASTSGGPFTVDINEGGTSILSTKLTIDDNEKTSTTAATAAVISDTALADDAEITIDVDDEGAGAKGLKVTLIGVRA